MLIVQCRQQTFGAHYKPHSALKKNFSSDHTTWLEGCCSPIRDQTQVPAVNTPNPNHWITGDSLKFFINKCREGEKNLLHHSRFNSKSITYEPFPVTLSIGRVQSLTVLLVRLTSLTVSSINLASLCQLSFHILSYIYKINCKPFGGTAS